MIIFSTMEDTDDCAFMESLYFEYVNLLYRISKKYIQDDAAAEDAVHDAFVKLIPKVSLLRELDCCRLRAYLVSTIRNTAISSAKKLKEEHSKKTPEDFSEAVADIPDRGVSPEDALLLRERQNEFSAILQTLAPKDRYLLEAKYYYQLTNQEIADIFQVKPASVRSMLTRARRKVLDQMMKEADTYG